MTQIQSGATWEYWRNIFELVNRSGEPPRDWCLRNRIDFEEFRPYASILERQHYILRHEREVICLVERSVECSVEHSVERSFEIRPIEGTPFVEVPITSRKTIEDLTRNPWDGHTPSLVITSGDLHLSFYGELTEEKVRAVMRGVRTSV